MIKETSSVCNRYEVMLQRSKGFCGNLYLAIVEYKDNCKIKLAFGDQDDYEVSFEADCKDKKNQSQIAHELVNWIRDMEYVWLDETAFKELSPLSNLVPWAKFCR